MSDDLNISDMAAIRGRLGPLYDDLHQTMLDVDTAPLFLFSKGSPRLVEVRDKAAAVLDRWAVEEPNIVGRATPVDPRARPAGYARRCTATR